jgi:hypothetical protein
LSAVFIGDCSKSKKGSDRAEVDRGAARSRREAVADKNFMVATSPQETEIYDSEIPGTPRNLLKSVGDQNRTKRMSGAVITEDGGAVSCWR